MTYQAMKRYHKNHGNNEEFQKMLSKHLLKKVHKQRKPVAIPSLRDEERKMYRDDDCEGYIKYGFAYLEPGEELTDEEITQELYEYMELRICSPYDCTGRPFTICIDWHRNPDGSISYVHHIGFDV